ncbi:MAG TPA: proline dehydrogenase family protein [Terriglobia bacterium]|jgi:proline dehydrogenase|nr:proline dehydrogenase family protein [Terriglobia bacterium]
MLRAFLLYLSERSTPRRLLTGLPAARKLPQRFIAGEALEDALATIRRLNADGFDVTLDHLGESVTRPAEAEATCRGYLDVMERLQREGLRANISVKLTALGLALDEGLARQQVGALVERAGQLQTFVRIDMEGSAFTESTLRVFRLVDAPRDRLGIVIQSYLYRSEQDVDDLLARGARIRLVKGAYKEPPEIAFPKKADVDANFVKLTEKMLASGIYHAIGTHDAAMVDATLDFARRRNIGPDKFEFQMLYGVRRRLQRELLQKGYRVRIYVPYGEQWYPYFMRRLAERPANVLFLLRNLVRG